MCTSPDARRDSARGRRCDRRVGFLARNRSPRATPYKIALSNSFIGNKWRIEMENLFKAACKMEPYKTQVDCSVFNSGNDVSKQTQQISNLISEGVDAIVINAASPTGLNGIISQACARGILVISFDNIVTAPVALTGQHRPVRSSAQQLREALAN